MGNVCNASSAHVRKSEQRDSFAASLEHASSIEFYRRTEHLTRRDASTVKSSANAIIRSIQDVIDKAKSYQQKFFAVSLCSALAAEHADYRSRLCDSALMKSVLRQLRDEIQFIGEFLYCERPRIWRERFILLCLELVCRLANEPEPAGKVFSRFMLKSELNLNAVPFYTRINYTKICDMEATLGNINRSTHA